MSRETAEAELLAWMREEPGREDDARFEHLALELFRHQFTHCEAYGRFCRGRGATPERVERWEQIPPVPTGAFKEVALRCFPPQATVHRFRTSGTATAQRGELALDSLALYEASLVPSFERGLLPDVPAGGRVRMLVLAPSSQELPDSSLSHMFQLMLARRGDPGSGFFVRDGALETDRLLDALAGVEADPPLLLAGTAFAFVHLLEAMEREGIGLRLPASARLMETGGFKGRARERPRDVLYAELEAALGLPTRRMVNQYGMTELASQFYDTVLGDPQGPRRKARPPWTRVRLLDPAKGEPAAAGAAGLLTILDLANTGSVCAVQTADLGRSVADGFEVLGRKPGAEARGCSIAADEMLGA